MAESSQEKTEEATPKRRREARKRGQVPRSRELSTAAVVAAAVMAMNSSGAELVDSMARLMRRCLQIEPTILNDPERIVRLFGEQLMNGFLSVAVVLGATLLAALVAPALIGGFNFSADAIKPDFSRIDPLKGLGRMASSHALVELGKSLLKFSLIGAIGALYIWLHRADFSALAQREVASACGQAVRMAFGLFAWLTGALVLIAAIDAPYQVWSYTKQLRMSRQEVRDEMKDSEGKPEVKARIRRLQAEMAKQRMMETVPTADVVVTNPTHYAVALKYAAGKMRAPRVVAKGADYLADAIREVAREHRIPLVAAPPLARALYRGVNLDKEIPPQLYAAVAKVLTYVYQLKYWRGGVMPEMPDIGDIEGGAPDPER
jgi:flagellar biosynthetic protein FlhB